ncbi:MAG: hypothetical protein GF349_03005 [Candidatus Magasanikbacteria bacterium]|nr:hypothetical protein [Candidatus Magasanikbacteria bacterium]
MPDQSNQEPQSNVFKPEPIKPTANIEQNEQVSKDIIEEPKELSATDVQEQKESEPNVQEASQQAIQERKDSGLKHKIKRKKKKTYSAIPQTRDELSLQIEKIMEEGLDEAFESLTPTQKQEFKIKGEETAIKIRNLLRSAKVKVKEVFTLIIEWLKILPGVNKFFLEQEAKIKADKILSLRKK